VDALTGGKGMTVMGGFANAGNAMDGINSLGHPGIMQSVMSYGVMRNMHFTEMELAAFQDMGYKIDRSQFFGKSYYYDVGGDTQTNNAVFGTLANPNTSMFGLGTHIMRDNLSLIQMSSIYANGYAGAGIRVDGINNNVTIPQGVNIFANGEVGTGLLVAYGNNNKITLDGSVMAMGYGGIGAHFGIQNSGGNGIAASHMTDERLDWWLNARDFSIQQKHEIYKIHSDLQGALVQEFNISGFLAGSLAAIYIEPDSHVANINVHEGAAIVGDISSDWARNRWNGDYATNIIFGQTGQNKPIFMHGDIVWNEFTAGAINSLDIAQNGGHFYFNGDANVHSWQINDGATLSGNSMISTETAFINSGTIKPGNSIGTITIAGDYTQSSTGELFMEFTSSATDRLVVNGNANIEPGSRIILQPAPDFYATGAQRTITDAELFSGNISMMDFDFFTTVDVNSPTLNADWDTSGANPVFSVIRASNAYSQYARGATGASVGNALSGLGGIATGDMQNLLAAIDFSATDGSVVRSALRQLAPTAYDNTAKTSMNTGRAISGNVMEHNDKKVFFMPFGGYYGQSRWNDNQGFDSTSAGIMGGANREFSSGVVGLHAAAFTRSVKNRSEASVRSNAEGLNIGVHASILPHESFFINGLVNIGFEETKMIRNI
jgi:hypothetical protein